MKRPGLAILLAMLPGLAGADDWTGIWTAELDWCRYADRIGSHNPAPVRFTETGFEGLENSCDITGVKALGDLNAWYLRLSCQSEGSTYDETTLVMLDGADVMWRWFGGGEPMQFQRCPGTR